MASALLDDLEVVIEELQVLAQVEDLKKLFVFARDWVMRQVGSQQIRSRRT